MKRLAVLFAVITVLSISFGCQQQKQVEKQTLLPEKPVLELQTIVKFMTDGCYLTEQSQDVFAAPAMLKVSASEPYGKISWIAAGGKVEITDKAKAKPSNDYSADVFAVMTDAGINNAVLALYLANLRTPNGFEPSDGEKITFESRIYDFYGIFSKDISVYKDSKTGKKDLAIAQSGQNRYILQGYNYLKVDSGGSFPTKIDVYNCNDNKDKKLVVQFSSKLR